MPTASATGRKLLVSQDDWQLVEVVGVGGGGTFIKQGDMILVSPVFHKHAFKKGIWFIVFCIEVDGVIYVTVIETSRRWL